MPAVTASLIEAWVAARERALSMNLTVERLLGYIMESLILAQNKRWRRVLSMQVERQAQQCAESGGLVSNAWVIYLRHGDSH